MNKERLIALFMIILAAAAARLLPHPANVTPVAALALFSGAQFERKWLAFAVPFAALLLSDAVLGFYDQMWVTYLGFAAVTALGLLLHGNVKPLPVAAATLSGSVLFFLITNCALLHYGLYPQTWDGMMTGYTMALPFFRNTLLGDAFYVALLFGGFALAERRFDWLRVRGLAVV